MYAFLSENDYLRDLQFEFEDDRAHGRVPHWPGEPQPLMHLDNLEWKEWYDVYQTLLRLHQECVQRDPDCGTSYLGYPRETNVNVNVNQPAVEKIVGSHTIAAFLKERQQRKEQKQGAEKVYHRVAKQLPVNVRGRDLYEPKLGSYLSQYL